MIFSICFHALALLAFVDYAFKAMKRMDEIKVVNGSRYSNQKKEKRQEKEKRMAHKIPPSSMMGWGRVI